MNRTVLIVASAALLAAGVFAGCAKKGQGQDDPFSGYQTYEGPTTVQVMPPARTQSGASTEVQQGGQQTLPGTGHHSTGVEQSTGRASGGGIGEWSGSTEVDAGMMQEPVEVADGGSTGRDMPGDIFRGPSPRPEHP